MKRAQWRLVVIFLLGVACCSCREARETPRDDGVAVESFGAPGSGPGEFQTPRGLDWSDDLLWVVDRSGRVQAFDDGLQPVNSIQVADGDRGFPLGILGDGEGGFLLCDTHRQRLRIFDRDGETAPGFSGPKDLALPQRAARAADGRIFLSEFGEGDENRIRVLNADGRSLRQFSRYGREPGLVTRAMAVCIIDDEVFVADASDRILVFDTEGRFRREFGRSGTAAGELRYPYGLCHREGELIVCEYANNRLQRFSLEGESRGTFGRPGRGEGEFTAPWDVTCGPDGRLYVCDSGNHRVVIVDPEKVDWEGVEG